MSVDYASIYEHHAGDYDRLVAAEDHEGRLAETLARLAPLEGSAVLDVGTGTGRIARQLLARGCRRLVGVERARAMLEVARKNLTSDGRPGWELLEADARALPVESGWADLAVAGWVFGHLRHWEPGTWRASIAQAIGEMRRALRPGGRLVLIETLGTGRETPAPPNAELSEYYAWLEAEQGLARLAIRTDYRFESPSEATRLLGFFFGEAKAALVPSGGRDLPECTGVFWG